MLEAAIPIRNLRFAIGASVPRYWHGGRKSVTHYFDALSVFFPVGERFFIASVRAQRHHVKDARLQADVRAFCAQEGVHGREHDRYNEMLTAQGYPIAAMEARVTRLLAFVTKITPKRWRLAATCALEHFTALMAHLLLENGKLLDGAHPQMAALWKWHAAEENEHRAVAFNVYEAAGGYYAERIVTMAIASAIFLAKMLEHQARMMHADGTLFSVREWLALGRFLFVEPGGMGAIVPLYLAYYRPGFHPNDIDASGLIEAWKREYAASAVYHDAA